MSEAADGKRHTRPLALDGHDGYKWMMAESEGGERKGENGLAWYGIMRRGEAFARDRPRGTMTCAMASTAIRATPRSSGLEMRGRGCQ